MLKFNEWKIKNLTNFNEAENKIKDKIIEFIDNKLNNLQSTNLEITHKELSNFKEKLSSIRFIKILDSIVKEYCNNGWLCQLYLGQNDYNISFTINLD